MTISVNGTDRACAPGLTVASLVAELDLPPRGIAVAIDGDVVRRSEWETTAVRDKARVDVVTAMQGG
ncbi:MAG TPA: sulfur carrier protein ThiS [Intrasporangium sp.]|uniref:sulfur carrier protein ThiS n=1 Tax=Intrasporangium sp. TaxID=1925024 RepID=UPI002D788BC0|nr:sulfur carrier protein ThiS [Intrasporangium sp.]HET7397717.1 sulfur carrier protein ThiS [Intrasporangium sp.]